MKELLELAARSIGKTVTQGFIGMTGFRIFEDRFFINEIEWNPLERGEDALNLAIELRLKLDFDSMISDSDRDPQKTARLAIVNAAAELGKSK